VKQKWRKGTAIVLDDAGLALYNRESMTRVMRDVSKIFQSVRYKNLCILLTLPSFAMLDLNVRRLVDAYIEVLSIDRTRQQTICKYHWLDANPHSGVIYRHRQIVTKKVMHPLLGVEVKHRQVLNSIRVDKPPQELITPYEREKRRCMDANYDRYYQRMVKDDGAQKTQRTFLEDYKFAKKNLKRFLDSRGKVSMTKLVLAGLFENRARMVARELNDELRAEKKKKS